MTERLFAYAVLFPSEIEKEAMKDNLQHKSGSQNPMWRLKEKSDFW